MRTPSSPPGRQQPRGALEQPRGALDLGYMRAIDQREVNRVVDRAMRVQLQEDRMLLTRSPRKDEIS